MLTITLPFPPSVNHYWRHFVMGRSARSLISKPGRRYTAVVEREVHRQKAALGIKGHVSVSVLLHPPDRRRRDVDNYCKSLLDAMVKAGVMEDDSQVRDLRLSWGPVAPGGVAVVEIRELPIAEQGRLEE